MNEDQLKIANELWDKFEFNVDDLNVIDREDFINAITEFIEKNDSITEKI